MVLTRRAHRRPPGRRTTRSSRADVSAAVEPRSSSEVKRRLLGGRHLRGRRRAHPAHLPRSQRHQADRPGSMEQTRGRRLWYACASESRSPSTSSAIEHRPATSPPGQAMLHRAPVAPRDPASRSPTSPSRDTCVFELHLLRPSRTRVMEDGSPSTATRWRLRTRSSPRSGRRPADGRADVVVAGARHLPPRRPGHRRGAGHPATGRGSSRTATAGAPSSCPDQSSRQQRRPAPLKLNPIRLEIFAGQRRAADRRLDRARKRPSRRIVAMMARDAWSAQGDPPRHLLEPAGPTTPCFYGIDMPSHDRASWPHECSNGGERGAGAAADYLGYLDSVSA